MDNSVHDCLGNSLITHNIIAVLYWYFRCDYCGFLSVFNDLHQVHSGLGIKGLHAKVIQYQQVRPLYLFKFLQYISFGLGYL